MQSDPVEMEEVSSAAAFIKSVIKAAKGFVMYLPNNPLHRKFFVEAFEKLSGHIDRFGDLSLVFDHATISAAGKTVYENEDPKESLAFRIYSDGVRCLLFEKGLQEDEMQSFVEIISRSSSDDEDDDIVTRMWAEGLPHIAYILAEEKKDLFPADLGVPEVSRETQRTAVSAVPRTAPPAPKLSPAGPSDPRSLLHLTVEDSDALARMIEADAIRDTYEDVSNILRSILLTEEDLSVYRETTEILSRLVTDFILIEELGKALCLVEAVSSVLRDGRLPPARKELLESLPAMIFTADLHESLRQSVERAARTQRSELRRLVSLLGAGAAGVLCSYLGELQSRDARKCVVDGLVEAGSGSPEVFFPYLSDDRWYLVRNTILILRRIGDPESLQRVTALSSHADERVRKEVLLSVEESSRAGTEESLLRFLDDGSTSVRIHALKALGRRRSPRAFARADTVTTSRDFSDRSLEERAAWYETMARIDPDAVHPRLRRLLLKRRIFRRKKEKDDVSCAVAGLRAMHDRDALATLIAGTAHRKGELRALIEKAIAEVGRVVSAPEKEEESP